MFNSHSLCAIVSGGDVEIVKWCQKVGLLRRERTCDVCGGEARIYHRRSGTGHSRWRCIKGGDQAHSWEESVTKDTIFEGTKFGIGRILRLFYFFAHGFTKYSDLIRETSTSEETTSESTVSQWLTYCRKVCSNWLERKFEEDKLGGPGVTIQIGQTTIGKRKSGGISNNNKRRATEDQWVVGMVEVKNQQEQLMSDVDQVGKLEAGRFRVEVCPGNARDESTLVGFLRKHVKPGSAIVTDCWRETYGPLPYERLMAIDEDDTSVAGSTDADNRQRRRSSLHCVDNLWKALKKEVCRGGNRGINENLADHLSELMWRREMDRADKDRFLGFVQCAVDVYNLY